MSALARLVPVPDAEPAPEALAAGRHSLLRFITCGSVDDGKSTLIGRMLFEAGAVFEDQLDSLAKDSRKFGTQGEALDFALLVDGLSAEREQGITIDVAYRYFATPRRSFIVADTPGHEQYTRNMATGASTADLAVILVDARKGLLPQTRRHSYIVSSLGVRDIVVAINKMDLVGFDEAIFRRIEADYRAATAGLNFRSVTFIPLSARDGDNVVVRSGRTPWYSGPALLPVLEEAEPAARADGQAGFLLPVQWINRPDLDFRGFAGTLAAGTLVAGDAVTVLPSGRTTRIARVIGGDGDLTRAHAGQAITVTTVDEVDIARGDVLVGGHRDLKAATQIAARLIWTGAEPLEIGREYQLKLGTALVNTRVALLHDAVDIETFEARPAASLPMNGIGHATLRLDAPVVCLPYDGNRDLGGFILIDRISNETVGFGLVSGPGATEAGDWRSRLAQGAQDLIGAPGSERRGDVLALVSWRLASAGTLAGIVAVVTGQPLAGLAAGAADIVARSVLRTLHDGLWRRARERSLPADVAESGGGI